MCLSGLTNFKASLALNATTMSILFTLGREERNSLLLGQQSGDSQLQTSYQKRHTGVYIKMSGIVSCVTKPAFFIRHSNSNLELRTHFKHPSLITSCDTGLVEN